MKNLFTISLLSLCILFSSIAVIYSTNDPALLKADEHPMRVSSKIDDETYAVLIFNVSKIYLDQFEFDAGDVFRLTSEEGNLTGTWTATDIGRGAGNENPGFTYFTAKVEAPDITSTTTTTETELPAAPQFAESEFTVNIWGFVTGGGLMIGGGAYFGADVFFLGYTKRVVGGDPEFGNISPNEGRQESTLTDVTITGVNTTFQDDPPVDVKFIPDDGLTISNISTIDNTHIEFDLTIAVDAPTTSRGITVTYDEGNIIISDSNVFTVTDRLTGSSSLISVVLKPQIPGKIN